MTVIDLAALFAGVAIGLVIVNLFLVWARWRR